MSIEKRKCPVFKKEKDIRQLMSEEKYTYKKVLGLYQVLCQFTATGFVSLLHSIDLHRTSLLFRFVCDS